MSGTENPTARVDGTPTTNRERLELLDVLAAGDGQNWPDLYDNPGQQQIAETMYGPQADALLASSWLADVRRKAALDAIRSATSPDSALAAILALCDVVDEAARRPAHRDFEPIEIPWTVAVRAVAAASVDRAEVVS